VQVRQEMQNQPGATNFAAADAAFSMADWIYTDYFLLLARQMVQAASEALRDFKYPIIAGQTSNQIVDWINSTGRLAGNDTYALGDLFTANQTHQLNKGAKLTVGVTHAVDSQTFNQIAARLLNGALTGLELAEANASRSDILRGGSIITYPGKNPYTVQSGDQLTGMPTLWELSSRTCCLPRRSSDKLVCSC